MATIVTMSMRQRQRHIKVYPDRESDIFCREGTDNNYTERRSDEGTTRQTSGIPREYNEAHERYTKRVNLYIALYV